MISLAEILNFVTCLHSDECHFYPTGRRAWYNVRKNTYNPSNSRNQHKDPYLQDPFSRNNTKREQQRSTQSDTVDIASFHRHSMPCDIHEEEGLGPGLRQ